MKTLQEIQQSKPFTASLIEVMEQNASTTARNEWSELIGIIVTKINAGRVGTKWKPVTNGIILKKVKGMKTDTLRDFVKDCTNQKVPFSQCFYGKLKANKLYTGSSVHKK